MKVLRWIHDRPGWLKVYLGGGLAFPLIMVYVFSLSQDTSVSSPLPADTKPFLAASLASVVLAYAIIGICCWASVKDGPVVNWLYTITSRAFDRFVALFLVGVGLSALMIIAGMDNGYTLNLGYLLCGAVITTAAAVLAVSATKWTLKEGMLGIAALCIALLLMMAAAGNAVILLRVAAAFF